MFNPVSFRRIVEVWNAGQHLMEMRATLSEMEETLGRQGELLHDVPVAKVFANGDYRETWDARWAEGHGVCQWASVGEDIAGAQLPHVQGPAGVGKVHAAGWVDVPALLQALEAHFEVHHNVEHQTWNVDDGLPAGADVLVDCRGVGAADELSKVGVQINPNHGDVLTLSTPLEGPHALDSGGHTINNGKWLLPTHRQTGRQHWRLGATYAWHKTKASPDGHAADELRKHMAKVWDGASREAWGNAQLEKHEAGLRPASPDRRPMVGPWPGQPKGVLMLNGLGTRGVLVGPSAALALVRWWMDGVPIPEEMDLSRFKAVRERFQD